MKKNLYFILLIMSSLLAACKKEPKEEVVGYKFSFEEQFKWTGTVPSTFLFLYDEKGNVLKSKETQSYEKMTITTEKDGTYGIGFFRDFASTSSGTKYYKYNVINSVSNNKTWNLLNSINLLSNTCISHKVKFIIEDLPNYDSIYTTKSNYGQSNTENPSFDLNKKELSVTHIIDAVDYTFLYVREHKDSSFRYELIKIPIYSNPTPISIRLNYQKLKKAKTSSVQIDKNIEINKIIVSTDKGLVSLYEPRLFNYLDLTSVVLPSEPIKEFYVECYYKDQLNSAYFYDKVTDLNKITKPYLCRLETQLQTNGKNIYKLIGENPLLLIKHISFKKTGISLDVYETFPYVNDNSLNRESPFLPNVLLKKFNDLNNLYEDYEYIYMYSLKDKSVSYSTFLDKIYEGKYCNTINTWIYDVGWTINE